MVKTMRITRTTAKKTNDKRVDNEAMRCYLLYFSIKAFKFILKALIIALSIWFIVSTIDVVAHNNNPYPVFWLGGNNFYNVLVEVSDKLNLIMGWA